MNGAFLKPAESDSFLRLAEKADRMQLAQTERSDGIRASWSYRVADGVRRLMDDWFLDPLIGLAFPAAGDTVSALAALPVLHLAAVRIKSPRLVAAILFTIIIDWLLGLIPGVGDIADALHKSNKIAHRLCNGFIDRDPATMREINIRAGCLAALAVVIAASWIFFFDMVVAGVRAVKSLF